MKRFSYPFSALVGQEHLKTALMLNAVDPRIGGILVRGHKGSGKSTAVRALAALLPPLAVVADCAFNCDPNHPDELHPECAARHRSGETLPVAEIPAPMVELPLSATEDRIVGALHLEAAISEGRRSFEPGLLAKCHRGILYVDEVNLLPDHLVDLLLDVSASGINIVEREQVRYSHPSRFLLIGTMNPEEGELRPQFLDRFGFCISIETIVDARLRGEIVKRRLAFDNDPAAFLADWQAEEEFLSQHVRAARSRLAAIEVPDEMITTAAELSVAAEVQGHRSDLTLVRAATALTALLERDRVTLEELSEAARLTLPHRLPASIPGGPEQSGQHIDEILARIRGGQAAAAPTAETADDMMIDIDFPGAAAAGSTLFTYLKKKLRAKPSSRTKPLS